MNVVDYLIAAQSCNAAEDRAIYNPTPEVDSAIEHALVLRKTATSAQRPHIEALIAHLVDVRRLNREERENERAAAGIVDPITTKDEFAKLARPILADLLHPFMGAERSAARLAELHVLFARTSPRTRSAVSVRQLLGVKKYTRLIEELAAWVELQAVASEHVL